MTTPYLAQVEIFSFNFAPKGWAQCNGQLLPINQNQALFSLLGTTYGGDGRTTFGLPDLRSRVPMKYGQDPVGNQYVLGQEAGEETITISSQQMPIHTHTVSGSTTAAHKQAPAAGFALGTSGNGGFFYAPGNSASTPINPGTVSTYLGGGQAHTNLQPYLAINWCIALTGIFPSRN